MRLNNLDRQLLAAASDGDLNLVKSSLENGAFIESVDFDEDLTPLGLSIRHGYYDCAKFLIENGADIHRKTEGMRWGLLHFAVERNNPKLITLLIDHGIDANTGNYQNRTALHVAAYLGYLDCVDCLILHGANPCAETNNKLTPFRLAMEEGREDVAEYLANLITAQQEKYSLDHLIPAEAAEQKIFNF